MNAQVATRRTWDIIQGFLRIWLPLMLVLGGVMWLFYRTEVTAQINITRGNEQHVVQLAGQRIVTRLAVLSGDVFYLSEHTSLRRWLTKRDAAALTTLAADFQAFARHRRLYDQVRFLDEEGREVLRIDAREGRFVIAPQAALQDKSGRYYVSETLALNKGELYISPLDLNVEQGVIEQPLKPVLRMGTPVFDNEGRKRGLIVLNYLGQPLLDSLGEIRNQHAGQQWLLNAEGYWLRGPQVDLEWGFMYPGRQHLRFEHTYPRIWAAIQAEPIEGQVLNESGLFSYARISSIMGLNVARNRDWFLVAHVPAAALAAKTTERTQGLVNGFLVLVVVATLASAMLAYHGMQRRRGEIRIRESEARFRGLLESAPDAIVIVDSRGHIALVNAQAENWFGYSRGELLGQAVEVLVPERFRVHHVPDRNSYMAEPAVRPMGAQQALYARHRDGSEFPVEISLSPLQTEQGQLFTSVIRDITARKQAEEARQRVEARYRELVNNLPVGVFRTNGGDGRFLEANPALEQIYEAESSEELFAHTAGDFYVDPTQREVLIDKLMQGGAVTGEEIRLKTLRGREFYASVTMVKKRDASGGIYFDGLVEDITLRKESEQRIKELNTALRARSMELEASNEELDTFCYSVSHDLRAPLRAIDGFSRALLTEYTERLDDKGRDRLNRVRSAAQRMGTLIDDLLKLSRVSRAELTREPVDLAQLAADVMSLLEQEAPQRRLHFDVQPDLVTQGDSQLLRIVLDNLLGNAWKFTGKCAVAEIALGGHRNGKEYVYFVRDNGAGFDMAYADKLFDPFQRLHDNHEFPGTGIGLATVQRIIQRHSGRIWAESTIGQGASFYFTLNEGKM